MARQRSKAASSRRRAQASRTLVLILILWREFPIFPLVGNDGLSRICACPSPSQRDCQLRGLSNHQHPARYRGSIAVAIACLVNDTSSGPTKMRRSKCLQLVQCLPNSDFEGTSRLATETFPIAKVARGHLYIHRSGKMFLQYFPQPRGSEKLHGNHLKIKSMVACRPFVLRGRLWIDFDSDKGTAAPAAGRLGTSHAEKPSVLKTALCNANVRNRECGKGKQSKDVCDSMIRPTHNVSRKAWLEA
jgi:hypothetical protein